MNIFNRLFMALLSLVVVVAGVIVLLLLTKLITPAVVSPNGFLTQQWSYFTQLSITDAIKMALIAVGLILIGGILFILELTPRKRRRTQKTAEAMRMERGPTRR
ncbi:hypothetical protein [Ktedonospora formicarum]|uniref:Uncharacterized protein n=1 Tax=Ktedonospora formicarum TaxID=2778364 RepID=A0A8J3I276_9CHLR|nr:hypothetical protein [Ktedonospora formicarum]GHO46246.1 hypothetical protein KSX_44090 [Ktedonospora formicarum]